MSDNPTTTPQHEGEGTDTPRSEAGVRATPVSREPSNIRESSGEMDHGDEAMFDVQLSEIQEDPNQVNVHQFYPELEHQFMKSHSNFVNDQQDKTQKAIQDMVAEDSGLKPDVPEIDNRMQMVPSSSLEGSTQWTKEDENNSSDPQLAYYMACWRLSREEESRQSRKSQKSQRGFTENEGLFSTAVDEETINEAKSRQKQTSIFQTESWGTEKPVQPSMKQIMEETAEKHYTKALKLKQAGDQHGVIICVNKVLSIKGEDAQCFVERAEAYIRLCDFQSAILNYKKACLLEPANEEFYNRLSFLYYFQGQSLFDQRLYPEALESFSRAAEMRPDNVGYHIRSITCLAALQRHGECLALVNKRLEIDMDNADLYVMRARLHEMFRNTTLCYYDVKDALGLNPDHSEAVRMMEKLERVAKDNKRQAMQLNLMGKHREALQKISIAIETDPAVADFHVLRGALHRKIGDYNAAIDDFLLALDKCDHNEESPIYYESQRQLLLTYNDFAVECFTKGFFDEAIILLNKAIKGEKREKGLYVNRGDCFFRQEDFNFAMQDYEQALDLDKTDETVKSRISVIHNEFGVSHYQDKMYSEAENRFSNAIEFHPKIGQYYISRARARYMLENMTGARGDLLMGLLMDPNNEDVISILSRLFPGKSAGDVLSSRAAESAKYAIRQIFHPPKLVKEEDELSQLSEEDAGDKKSKVDNDDESETSYSGTESTESMWKPPVEVSEFRFMMEETEFNVKLVEVKQEVNSKVKTALLDRRSLKYGGPRVQPLPPPNPKPSYGGRGIRREKVITPAGKQKNSNWSQLQFSSGIGLGGN